MLRKARQDAENYLRETARKKGTVIKALGEPVERNGGVQVDAITGNGKKWCEWAGFGDNPPMQVTWDED